MPIYVATGNDIPEINRDKIKKIIIGNALKKDDKGCVGCYFDDAFDNISVKNPYYCELTALYWVWKNTDEDIYGLAHYRRYLWINNIDDSYVVKCFDDVSEIVDYIDINDESLLLTDVDIVLPKRQFLRETIIQEYSKNHFSSDIAVVYEVLKERFSEYYEDAVRVFNNHGIFLCNMFITKKLIFDKYMSWLFEILFEVEKRIDISTRDKYQQRVFGFLAERLFNVFIYHNHLKVKEVPMIFIKKESDDIHDQFDDWKYKIKKYNPF